VIDASSPTLDEQRAEVERVLGDIGAHDIPQILVYNKLDRLEPSQRPRTAVDWIEREPGQRVPRVFISAAEGDGLDELRRLIAERAAAVPEGADTTMQEGDEPSQPDDELPVKKSLQA
jgi:GTP-binding protein HflX